MKHIPVERCNKIYDVLVNLGSASESDRGQFVYVHSESEYGCREWRFQGKLGFGGKYRSETNRVDCYIEDETSERLELMAVMNDELLIID